MRADLNYTGAGMLPGITRYSDVAGTAKVATSSYTYDGAGNRITTAIGPLTQTYTTTTGNQMTGDGTWSYTYDANGNVTKKTLGASSTTWVYGYDVMNEMTSAKEYDKDPGNGGTLLQEDDYTYDAFKNRIESNQTTGSVLWDRRYALDGWDPHLSGAQGTANWNVLADLDGSNNLTTHYLRGDKVDQILAEQDHTGSMNWTVTDRQGSVRLTTTNSGGVQDSISYDGYGNATETAPAYGGRYKWTGREYDTETALQYNRARYDDASTGRWMSQDPLGFDAGDSNLYRYVHNEPTNDTDPSGLIDVTTTRATDRGNGGYDVRWTFALSKVAPADGYIVQKVTYEYDYKPIPGVKTNQKAKQEKGTFWEAWFVKKGQKLDTDFGAPPDDYTDTDLETPHPGTEGKIVSSGEIKFFLKTVTGNLGDPGATPIIKPDPATGWGGKNQVGFSGPLPSTKIPPAWWKNASDNGEGTGARSVTVEWGQKGRLNLM